ncbi:unnamed protein product [Gulo gulo]|uniref:Uncharacterized protein n=1 Tax=Gulo gulo TaxID=48420 RepID=A0A9X9LPB3_GULGU|nr:unnamed protein product [Gulo gulo]
MRGCPIPPLVDHQGVRVLLGCHRGFESPAISGS